jgi:hypothetical protein
VPSAQWASITSPATNGSNIITNEVSNITFAQAKTSLFQQKNFTCQRQTSPHKNIGALGASRDHNCASRYEAR